MNFSPAFGYVTYILKSFCIRLLKIKYIISKGMLSSSTLIYEILFLISFLKIMINKCSNSIKTNISKLSIMK